MTSATLDSIVTEIYVSSAWLDISSYVVGDIDADGGILGNSPSAKLASIGGLRLTLNNTGNKFSPNHVNMITGWKRGIPLRIKITFEGVTHIKFKGRIENIGLPYTFEGLRVVPVIVNDWLKIASDYPFSLEGIQTNKTSDEAVQAVITALPIAPDATDLSLGSENLPVVFSSSTKGGTAYSELSKLALTEFGFTYLKRDKTFGETLVSENRHDRVNRTPTELPVGKELSPILKLSDGSLFKLSDGSYLSLGEVGTSSIDYMKSYDATYGDSLVNKVVIRSNPSRVDTSLQVLFSLNDSIEIASGQTLNDMVVYYVNPNGTSERINGMDMQAPVSSTDFQMWTNSNGTGTNLTSYLTFDVVYGSEGATYSNIKNNHTSRGYITKLNARGYGIYFGGSLDTTVKDDISANEIGTRELFINQAYQASNYVSENIANTLLTENSTDRIVLNKIQFLANLSGSAMNSFLFLDVGDLINVVISEHSINTNYFIQSVSFKIRQGGIIDVSWGLSEDLNVSIPYWSLETVGFSELESTTRIAL